MRRLITDRMALKGVQSAKNGDNPIPIGIAENSKEIVKSTHFANMPIGIAFGRGEDSESDVNSVFMAEVSFRSLMYVVIAPIPSDDSIIISDEKGVILKDIPVKANEECVVDLGFINRDSSSLYVDFNYTEGVYEVVFIGITK